jgi:hypothetical protein
LRKTKSVPQNKVTIAPAYSFPKAEPSVAKEKMEPVGNGNEFCGTL